MKNIQPTGAAAAAGTVMANHRSIQRRRSLQRTGLVALMVAAGLAGGIAGAQSLLPPVALDQLNHIVGSRIEAINILGGDYGAAGGFYSFSGGDKADLNITKVGGSGAVTSPMPLDLWGLRWAPILQGNLGIVSAQNTYQKGYLAGNQINYDTLAVEAGGGAALYINDHLSLSPTISGIYGSVQNKFSPLNANGALLESVGHGTLVDWTMDTWSVVPSMNADYQWMWGRTTFDFSSTYSFFHTDSFESSSPLLKVNGNSSTWANKMDVDVPLGWTVLGHELHTGGFFSRTELFGDAATGLNTDYVYTVNGRLVLDFLGKLWKVKWLGLGVSYYWGKDLSGWAAGADVRFKF
jgi:hypothetical protein